MWYKCPQTSNLGIMIRKWLIKLAHAALVLTTARVAVEMVLFLPAVVLSLVPTRSFWKQKTSIRRLCNKWGANHTPKVTSQGFPPLLRLLNIFSISGKLKSPVHYLSETLKTVLSRTSILTSTHVRPWFLCHKYYVTPEPFLIQRIEDWVLIYFSSLDF